MSPQTTTAMRTMASRTALILSIVMGLAALLAFVLAPRGENATGPAGTALISAGFLAWLTTCALCFHLPMRHTAFQIRHGVTRAGVAAGHGMILLVGCAAFAVAVVLFILVTGAAPQMGGPATADALVQALSSLSTPITLLLLGVVALRWGIGAAVGVALLRWLVIGPVVGALLESAGGSEALFIAWIALSTLITGALYWLILRRLPVSQHA